MNSPSRQRVKINKIPAFYTFLSSLYNCLLKFILLIILLGEMRKFIGEVLKISGEVQSHLRGGAHLPSKPGLVLV